MKAVAVKKKKAILLGVMLALLVSIPLTVFELSQQQNPYGKAAAGASLSFVPDSSASSPIQTNVGQNIDLDMYVDPGDHAVTFVRYQLSYDSTKLKLVSTTPVDLNSPTIKNIEGPVTSSGTMAQSIGVGNDPTAAITQKTKLLTVHFTAIGNTNGGTTKITFGGISEALSSGSKDQASENVLSTTTPAFISIGGSGPSISPSVPPLPTITGTALNFTLFLHGVGAAGDNPNPTGNSLSNKNPVHPQRNLTVQVYDTNNQVVANSTDPVEYDPTTGTFIGAVGLPTTVTSGNYSIKIQTDRYLRRLVPGIQQIVSGQQTTVAPVQMITGDTNNDNSLDIRDYNALLDCGYGQLNPLPMNDQNSIFNSQNCQAHQPAEDVDVNDDGIINSTDYNLFLRELSVQNGD